MRATTIVLLTFLFCIPLRAQRDLVPKKDKASILSLINTIEKKNHYNFSYDFDRLKDLYVKVKNPSRITLNTLKFLFKEQTIFELILKENNTYLIIQKKERLVCGQLIDQQTREGIFGATVKNNNHFASSNQQGNFQFRMKASDTIEVSSIGHQKMKLPFNFFQENDCPKIYLKSKINTLNEIIISDYLTQGITKNKDASITLSPKKLKILPGLVEPDIFQSIQLIPGINSPEEDAASIFIRGGGPDENLLIWDGIKVYATGHYFNQISAFNPFIIKSAKIYRSGTSSKYGDRISGVIDIKTDIDLIGEVQNGAGINLTHIDFYTKIPIAQNMGILFATRKATDFFNNIKNDRLFKKVFQKSKIETAFLAKEPTPSENKTDFYDLNFKWLWQIDKNKTLSASQFMSVNTFENEFKTEIQKFSKPDSDINSEISMRHNKEKNRFYTNTIGTGISYKYQTSKNLKHHLLAYSSLFIERYKNYDIDPRFEKRFGLGTSINRLADIGFQYDLNTPITKHIHLESGYQFSHIDVIKTAKFNTFNKRLISSPLIFEDNSSISNSHVLTNEIQLNKGNHNARIGIRSTYLSNTDEFLFEPRIFASLGLSKQLNITASFEQKNQQLQRIENTHGVSVVNYIIPEFDRTWLLAGKTTNFGVEFDIPVLKSQQITLGATFKSKHWHLDIEGYYKSIKDFFFIENSLLIWANNESHPLFAKEKRLGYDFLLKRQSKHWRSWIGYSWINTKVKLPNTELSSFNNNFEQTHILNISQTLQIKKIEIALGWVFSSGIPFTSQNLNFNFIDSPSYIDDKGINGRKFENYHRLDLSGLYRFSFKKRPIKGLIGVSFKNLYNRVAPIRKIISLGDINNIRPEGTQFSEKTIESTRFTPDVVFRIYF